MVYGEGKVGTGIRLLVLELVGSAGLLQCSGVPGLVDCD